MTKSLQKLQDFSTAEISDALDACGIEGALLDIKPLSPGMKVVGPAYTIKYMPNEKKSSIYKNAADYIDSVPAHAVVVIDNNGCTDCTTWGDILTQIALRNKVAGTIVYGAVRDVELIRAAKYPLFSTAIYMRSGKNRIHKAGEQCPLNINGVIIQPGDIIMADDNGVLIIPLHLLDDIIKKANNIQFTEQKIKSAIQSGSSLEQARKDFHYDQPWLGTK